MYVYDMLIFGYDVSKNKEVNTSIHEYDLEYHTTINGKYFEVYAPYHGGLIAGDDFPVIIGYTVTDNDTNKKEYLHNVKNFTGKNILADFLVFISQYKEMLEKYIADEEDDEDFKTDLLQICKFLDDATAEVYSVEVSS